jgi:aminomethyltransferase
MFEYVFRIMTQTALQQRFASSHAHTGIYHGVETALAFAGPEQEFNVLKTSAGIFDLAWRGRLIVTGEDRTRWLNGMVTNNVRDLPLNHGNYNFLLNPQGRIMADMFIYNLGDYLLLDTGRSQIETVQKTLDHFIIMDDVAVSDSGETLGAIGVCGPKAEEILRAAGMSGDQLEPLEVRDLVINNFGISVVRGPREKPGWYEIWAGGVNVESVWETLVKAGGQPVGAGALELWRVARGIPYYGQDIRERDLPQETEQQQALNFSKGCYIGQEIVERIRSRGQVHRKFTGFAFHGTAPAVGKLEENGRVVAELTSVAQIGGKAIGLGYVRREQGLPGSQIDFHGNMATIVDPPFPNLLN